MEVDDAAARTSVSDTADAPTPKRGVRLALDAVAYGPTGASSPRGVAGSVVGLFSVGVILLMLGVTDLWSVPDELGIQGWPEWWHAVTLGVITVAVAAERSHPVAALIVGAVATLADIALGGSLGVMIMLWELLYSFGVNGSARGRRVVTTTVVAIVCAGAVAGTAADSDVSVGILVALQLGAMFGMPLWWASNVRQKSELAELAAQRADLEGRRADLEAQRAADLERIGELRRSEAVQAERAVIACDLHDAIASRLSTIAIHSAAAIASPERDQQPVMRTVRCEALEALQEMRAMIVVLRSEPGRSAEQGAQAVVPGGLERLPELVEGGRLGGLRVLLDLPDRWEDTIGTLPVAVGQAAYRIIQEALANVMKHAPRAAVTVAVRLEDDDALRVVVENSLSKASGGDDDTADTRSDLDTDSVVDDHPALSAGTGLVTMRERAEALGGWFAAGPGRLPGPDDVDGGILDDGTTRTWRVQAALPTGGHIRRTGGAA
ncbi:sensor histidine kinase [Phytoactinopolyspora endophytica]|uniref:sensor histidine kinase n=1 Tax=Phytoactinopolyspora endophytica TaxID=1642495 RepID=UPI0013EB8408|nr:histidine kinase [Phytoactinopolyspora endophytica]